MNAERLHAVVLAVADDLEETRADNLVDQLVASLQTQVDQPHDPNYQQEVGSHLASLYEALAKARSNNFSPVWRQALKELGGEGVLGVNLADRVRGIFERNQITPALALDQMKPVQHELGTFRQAVEFVIAGFERMNIGAEELGAGECEVRVLIPRSSVSNRLKEFADELNALDEILGTLSEVATGSRPGFEIRSVSSSDLAVSVESTPAVAACIAVGTERVVSLYKQILEIRKLHHQLKKQKVPDKHLTGIAVHADSLMDDGIEEVVKDLMNEYYGKDDDGRRHELTDALRFTLKKIAQRIDKGYNIEVRVEPGGLKDQQEESGAGSQSARYVAAIRSAYKELQFVKPEGDTILGLEAGESRETAPKERETKRRVSRKAREKQAPSVKSKRT